MKSKNWPLRAPPTLHRHREARSDVAIQRRRPMVTQGWIASLRSQ